MKIAVLVHRRLMMTCERPSPGITRERELIYKTQQHSLRIHREIRVTSVDIGTYWEAWKRAILSCLFMEPASSTVVAMLSFLLLCRCTVPNTTATDQETSASEDTHRLATGVETLRCQNEIEPFLVCRLF